MSKSMILKSSIYYNLGDGFFEKNKISKDIVVNDVGAFTVNVTFDLASIPKEAFCHEFRFDPFEGYLSVFYEIEKNCKPANHDISLSNRDIVFLTDDPYFFVEINNKHSINIQFTAEFIKNNMISEIFKYKNSLFEQIQSNNILKHSFNKIISRNSLNIPKLDFNCSIHNLTNEKYILIVVHQAVNHGPGLLSLSIVKNISLFSNFKPVVILLMDGNIKSEFEKICPVYLIDIDGFGHNTRKFLLNKILSEIRNKGCNKAICNSVTTSIIADSLKHNGFDIVTLIHELPDLININKLDNAVSKVLQFSDKFVFASKFSRDAFINRYSVNKNDTYIIPQGIYKSSNISTFEEKLKLTNMNSNIVIGCGNGFCIKGVDLFVNVAIKLLQTDSRYEFVWLGNLNNQSDYVDMVFVKKIINYYNFENKINFYGFDSDIGNYFNSAKLFFLSSRCDCYPSVVLEALDRFLPVAIFENSGGAQDIINEKNGLVIPYEDVDSASKKIHNLLYDSGKYIKVATNAKKSVCNFSMKQYIEKIFEVIDKI